ncbi:MAG: ThuA domain-containing protein [Treponema sp.]|nr:ThuA domain-containing protein [Treponema sp.]
MKKINVTVWNEYGDDQKEKAVKDIYPHGMHITIAEFLNKDESIIAKTAVMQDAEHGLKEEVLADTDVLIWWGHMLHDNVEDYVVNRVTDHVRRGMGIIFLHSAHKSKPFMQLLGTSGSLGWREAGERARIWTCEPSHPIAQGVPNQFAVENEETYSEPFGIPQPLETVFISWFSGGNVFRSGVTFQRENGRIFYFQSGHETYPVYHNEHVQKIITNSVKWAAPVIKVNSLDCPNIQQLEKI